MRVLILAITLFFYSTLANAAQLVPGVYELLDHPDGSISPPPYGLRLDDLQPPSGVGPTFSTELGGAQALLTWDGGNSATITGSIYNNTSGDLWSVVHSFSGVTATSKGFFATGGNMVLKNLTNNLVFNIPSKSNHAGTVFEAFGDDHRCGKDSSCGPFIGRGWLEPGIDDYNAKYNDWLVQLVPIPIPGAFFLFISAILSLKLVKRASKMPLKGKGVQINSCGIFPLKFR